MMRRTPKVSGATETSSGPRSATCAPNVPSIARLGVTREPIPISKLPPVSYPPRPPPATVGSSSFGSKRPTCQKKYVCPCTACCGGGVLAPRRGGGTLSYRSYLSWAHAADARTAHNSPARNRTADFRIALPPSPDRIVRNRFQITLRPYGNKEDNPFIMTFP